MLKKIVHVEEVTTLFIHDNLKSLLVLFQDNNGLEFEGQFTIQSKTKVMTKSASDVLSMGSNFDVKEHIFRHLVQILGIQHLPQLLIRPTEIDSQRKGQHKQASVFWISPFGQLVASNKSFEINITAGYHLVNFPSNLPRMPGIWSAVFLDDDLKEPTEIEFVVWSKKHASKLSPNTIKEGEAIDYPTTTAFVDDIRKKKVAENHHSV